MTVTIVNVNGNLVFTFSKTATPTKMTDLANKSAEYLFNIGYGNHGTPEEPRTFADTTNKERLDILDQFIARTLRDTAHTQHITAAIDAARTDAEQTGDFEL